MLCIIILDINLISLRSLGIIILLFVDTHMYAVTTALILFNTLVCMYGYLVIIN